MWAQMSDEELLTRSDLIVMGEWVGQSEPLTLGGTVRVELGAIAIAEVLKGPKGVNATSAPTVALVRVAPAAAPASSSDLACRRGQRGLWLLRLDPGGSSGIYLADHPQRFVPADKDAGRIARLRALLGRT